MYFFILYVFTCIYLVAFFIFCIINKLKGERVHYYETTCNTFRLVSHQCYSKAYAGFIKHCACYKILHMHQNQMIEFLQ